MLSIEKFIEKAKELHGEIYNYSLVNFTNKKIKIVCNIHGIFEQTKSNHLMGKGCIKCNPNFGPTKKIDIFISEANHIHSNEYDYSLVEYINTNTKVKIICNIHGIFEQRPRGHLSGNKCPSCKGNKKLNTNDFIIRSNLIHNNKYDYSQTIINGTKSKVIIICPKHAIFYQVVDSHLRGHGCPTCNDSKGEKIIQWFLDKNKIDYIKQKTFDGCEDKRKLKFDFYLPSINTCIEYDGKHHFEIIEYGEDRFLDAIKKDNIKNNFCIKNNIRLLRIKYTSNIIEELEGFLKSF